LRAPTFDYALKNEEQIMPAENLSIEMIKTDTLDVVGKSFPSAKLVLTAEDKAFTATANAEGVWQITFSGNDLDNGRYNIKIQAQDEQKQLGSEEVALFSLLVGENSENISALRQEQKNNILNWINSRPLWLRRLLALGAIIILVALAVGIHFLVSKIRNRKIAKKSSEAPPQQVK
jgi:hypothetical protein